MGPRPAAGRIACIGIACIAAAASTAGCADLGARLAPPPRAEPEPGALAALDRLSPGTCNPAVASVLAGSGIPPTEVRALTYGLHRSMRRGRITGYDAWIALTDQPGAVVVSLDADCRPRQIYARGGATLPAPPR